MLPLFCLYLLCTPSKFQKQMKSRTKKILLDLSAELGISTNYLEKLVNAGSKMIFKEYPATLERKYQDIGAPDDLLEKTLLCCAYGEVLRRLVEESKL